MFLFRVRVRPLLKWKRSLRDFSPFLCLTCQFVFEEAYLGYMAPRASQTFAPPPNILNAKNHKNRSLYCGAAAKFLRKFFIIAVFGKKILYFLRKRF